MDPGPRQQDSHFPPEYPNGSRLPSEPSPKKKGPSVAVVVVAIVLAIGLIAGGIWATFSFMFAGLSEEVESIILACSKTSSPEACIAATGGPEHVQLPVPFPKDFKSLEATTFCRRNSLASVRGDAVFESAILPFTAVFQQENGEWALVLLGAPGSVPSICDDDESLSALGGVRGDAYSRGVEWSSEEVRKSEEERRQAPAAPQSEMLSSKIEGRTDGEPVDEPSFASALDEIPAPEPAAKASTWAEAVIATRPCWALNSGDIYARVANSSEESLASLEQRLSTAKCKKGREQADVVLGTEYLRQIDSAIEVYEKVVELHQEFMAREHPRADDKSSFKAAVDALRADFPSLAEQRTSMKVVYAELVREVRPSECRGPMERLANKVQELERAFSSGMPVANVKAREDAWADAAHVLRDLDARCSAAAKGVSRAATRLVEDAGLVLDYHEELVQFGTGEESVWRSKTVRIHDEATRLESSALAVYREMALFVATVGRESK
ncbi:MAG: hypothetical protein AAGA54_30080 [Myxococcota bacterium]